VQNRAKTHSWPKHFIVPDVLTNDPEELIETCDLIVECSGDAIYATESIDRVLKADIPVVTMNSEFHVTTGSYFVDKGLVTEAEGDQPGVEAILHEEALAMGFKPVAYVNIKGFLNENPTREEMEYWGAKSNLSLEMVTSFTDGTKVQIEQVLVANGLGACIAKEGLLKLKDDDMLHGGTILAEKAKEIGCPVSDYVLSPKLPAGVFLVVEHDQEQSWEKVRTMCWSVPIICATSRSSRRSNGYSVAAVCCSTMEQIQNIVLQPSQNTISKEATPSRKVSEVLMYEGKRFTKKSILTMCLSDCWQMQYL